MELEKPQDYFEKVRRINIPWDLIEAIRALPLTREVEHCGRTFAVPTFDFYAQCPQCGTRIKVRSCSGVTEIEEVFDAVFEWLRDPDAQELARRRQQVIEEDEDEDE